MRTPMRVVDHPRQEQASDDVDLRTWWGRNAKALGTVIGTALATLLVGTGGLTGLAKVAGIATTKELSAVEEKLVGVTKNQQAAAGADETRFVELGAVVTALTKEVRALRADLPKRAKKTKPVEE